MRRPATPNFVATDDCTVVLRYLPEEPIFVVHGDERNMKVTEPIDVYLADKLFQLTSNDAARRRAPRTSTAPPWPARRWWSSAAATASAPTSPSSPAVSAPTCFTFSRSSTNTHVERRDGHRWPPPSR